VSVEAKPLRARRNDARSCNPLLTESTTEKQNGRPVIKFKITQCARRRLSARLRLRPAINVARLPIVAEFHYHDRKAGIISKSLATRRAANEVVGNGAIFMRGRGRYQKRETIIIDGGLSRWAKYVARKTDGDLSGWKDRRRAAPRRAARTACRCFRRVIKTARELCARH